MSEGATLPPGVRTHFTGLHGPALPAGRTARLARLLGLPPISPAVSYSQPSAAESAGSPGPLVALLTGLDGADASALWLPPFAAWVEPPAGFDAAGSSPPESADAGAAAALHALLAEAAAVDLYVNLTTATAHDLQLGARLLAALNARRPLAADRRDDIELALHEAVSNALVHGNLGVAGMKELSAAELDRFSCDLTARLADPALAARRIAIAVRLETTQDGQPVATVEVADEGAGFVPGPRPGSGASGRGLDLIGTIADGLEIGDGGRCTRLRFRL